MRNHSNENEFDLHENGRAGETHFCVNGFARRVVLTQKRKGNGLYICFISKVPRVNKAAIVANDATLCCAILVLFLEFHPGRPC